MMDFNTLNMMITSRRFHDQSAARRLLKTAPIGGMEWDKAIFIALIFLSITQGTALFAAEIDPFTSASRQTGVPITLLVAISQVESRHHPWALNHEGKAFYPKTRSDAEAILSEASDNIDIGPMQIHYKTWGHLLKLHKVDLLDPYTNVLAGAVILRYLLVRYPFWEAIGRYHAGEKKKEGPAEKQRQIEYAWRVYHALIALRGT
jgi:hypothetical protein